MQHLKSTNYKIHDNKLYPNHKKFKVPSCHHSQWVSTRKEYFFVCATACPQRTESMYTSIQWGEYQKQKDISTIEQYFWPTSAKYCHQYALKQENLDKILKLNISVTSNDANCSPWCKFYILGWKMSASQSETQTTKNISVMVTWHLWGISVWVRLMESTKHHVLDGG